MKSINNRNKIILTLKNRSINYNWTINFRNFCLYNQNQKRLLGRSNSCAVSRGCQLVYEIFVISRTDVIHVTGMISVTMTLQETKFLVIGLTLKVSKINRENSIEESFMTAL